ncbi:MAG: DUF2254 family protein [Methylocella sp.]
MVTPKHRRVHHIVEALRRAFAEFLAVPTFVIFGFLLLAGLTYGLDRARNMGEQPAVGLAYGVLFSDQQAVSNFLGVIATSIIALTSITFALLPIAVQQGAAALTSQIFDQFAPPRQSDLFRVFYRPGPLRADRARDQRSSHRRSAPSGRISSTLRVPEPDAPFAHREVALVL